MANEKYVNSRMQQKIDTSANWDKAKGKFKPLNGEIIIYSDLLKMKIGDGNTTVDMLPFLSESEVVNLFKAGDGANSLVFNEGDANGKYSIAGGTTDKSLIEGIIGNSIAAALIKVNTPKADGDMSMSLGAGTSANAPGAMAFGANTQAGCKGYYFTEVNGNTLTLSTKQDSTQAPSSIEWEAASLLNLYQGDVVSIINGDIYPNCAEITKLVVIKLLLIAYLLQPKLKKKMFHLQTILSLY